MAKATKLLSHELSDYKAYPHKIYFGDLESAADDAHLYNRMRTWLCDNIEHRGEDDEWDPDGNHRWCINIVDIDSFLFKDKDDAMLFKLMWGGEYACHE